MNKSIVVMLLAALAAGAALPAWAQQAAAGAVSPAKKELVARVLKLQQPGIENMARQLAEQPAVQMLQQASVALQQRVPPERREAVAKELQADARKYVDEATPIVRERALSLAPTTIGTLLEDKLTEDELKQVIATLESPAYRKFTSLLGDMQRALGEKLVAETRASVDPKVRTLEQSMMRRLSAAAAASAPAAAPKN